MRRLPRPLLKTLSGLFINISAAWFIVSFVGPNISFPKSEREFLVLTWQIVLGIVFMLLSLWCEKELENE